MTTSFNIYARNSSSLADAFGDRGLDLSHFPTRTARKRANDGMEEELYVLRRYLFTLDAAGLLQFPLRLSKSETPDFAGSAGGYALGIEITEATLPADQREMTISERSGQPALLGTHGGRYRGGIRDDAPPERGRRADRDLTADVLRAIRRKWGLPFKTPSVDLVLYANGNANLMSDFPTFHALVCSRVDRWSSTIAKRGKLRRIGIIKEPKLILWDGPRCTSVLELRESLSHNICTPTSDT